MRQMDAFRGSLTPSFFSFRLENQSSEDDAATSPLVTSPPVSTDTAILDPQNVADLLNSPLSADSEQDISAYNEAKIQSIESDGLSSTVGLIAQAGEAGSEAQAKEMASQGLSPVVMLRTSTSIPTTDEWAASSRIWFTNC